jgi:subfamily B ATP-binding cassette protein HlyB/CyaB
MELEELHSFLETQSLLGLVLNADEILKFITAFPPVMYPAGSIIFEEGQPSKDLIISLSGEIRLLSSGGGAEKIQLGVLKVGRSANLNALIRSLPYQYSGEASQATSVIRIPWNSFEPFLKRNPACFAYLTLMADNAAIRALAKEISEIGCSNHFKVELLGSIQTVRLQDHSWILHQDQPNPFAFMLINGTIQSYKKAKQDNVSTLFQVPARTWLGWNESVNSLPATHSFRSTGDCELFQILNSRLLAIQKHFPEDFAKYTEWVNQATFSKGLKGNKEGERETVDLDELFPETPKRKWLTTQQFPWVGQENQMDCGPACLAMISKYYGNEIPIQFWRGQIYTNREGTSLFDLAQGAERNGFVAHGLYVESLTEIEADQLPVIAVRQYHYIVIYKITDTHVTVGDPGIGIRKLTHKEFYDGFENAILLARPTPEFYKIKVPPTTYGHYLRLFHGYGREISLILLCSLLLVVFSLFPPLLSQIILDEVISKKDKSLLVFSVGTVALIIALQTGMTWLRSYYIAYLTAKFDFNASSSFLRKMFTLPYSFFANRHIGDFTRRLSEMERLREFITSHVLTTFLDLLTLGVYAIILFSYSPLIALITIVIAPVSVLISMLFSKKLQTAYMESFSSRAEEESLLSDLIRGVLTIKALTAEVSSRWRLEEKIVESLKAKYRFSMTAAALGNVSGFYNQIIKLGLMGLAAYLSIQGNLSPGQVVSISIFVGYLLNPFQSLAETWSGLQELKSAMTRLNDIFLSPSEAGTTGGLIKNRLRGEIEFQDVWFRYGGDSTDWVLKGVSFKIEPGQKIALAGPSGSGKSTISNLLLRLFEPTQGQILIDGHDYREYDLSWLRSQLGLILQESHLFHGSISDNIAFGSAKIDESRVRKSAQMANAHDFVMKKPGGYSYIISHGGFGLSGGEKQRVSCARAFYLDPPVLILDEATSALDGVAEKDLITGLLEASAERTVISIAHRYTTARFFDHVILMSAGKIVGFGSHEYLKEQSDLYRSLFGLEKRAVA